VTNIPRRDLLRTTGLSKQGASSSPAISQEFVMNTVG
jgi:hypothetical protein